MRRPIAPSCVADGSPGAGHTPCRPRLSVWALDYAARVPVSSSPMTHACQGHASAGPSHGRPSLAVRGGLVVKPVDTDGSVVEHGGTLGSRVACGQPFERVVHNIVGVRNLVDREIAF